MLQPVSVGLKFGFLIVLYLFLFWVATSSLFDLRRGFGGRGGAGASPPDATGIYATVDPMACARPGVRAAPGGRQRVGS